MAAKPSTPLWMPNPHHPGMGKPRRLPRPHLPRIALDHKDRAALRQVGVYSVAAVLAGIALTVLIVLVALWIRLFLGLV